MGWVNEWKVDNVGIGVELWIDAGCWILEHKVAEMRFIYVEMGGLVVGYA